MTTKSTSPQPKRRRHQGVIDEEKMETRNYVETCITNIDLTKDDEVYWVDAREGIDPENEELDKRSRMQDEKIKMKEQKRIEQEEKIQEKRKLDQIEKEKKENEEKEAMRLERSRMKNKNRNQKKKIFNSKVNLI